MTQQQDAGDLSVSPEAVTGESSPAAGRALQAVAGGVEVTVVGVHAALAPPVLDRLVADGVAAGIAARTSTLWGAEAEEEAGVRLAWVDLPTASRDLLPRIAAIRRTTQAAGLDHVVLCGMGGSSLAPEVISRAAGVELTVLDSTEPSQVGAAVADRLDRTVVVVSSKSGGTVETDSQMRAFEGAFRAAGLDEAAVAARFVVVTDPGSPLEASSTAKGYTVVQADPGVGGRYSALTAFGLVPCALAGVDVAALLADAAAVAPACARDDADNPALLLGAALGAAHEAGRDKMVIATAGETPGFGDWAEQLVAESTGKQGLGLLPVVVEGADAPGYDDAGDDATRVLVGGVAGRLDGITVTGPLGALFLVWEYATSVAGRVIGINPFDQPNVEEAKKAARGMLDAAGSTGSAGSEPSSGAPAFTDGPVEVYGDRALLGEATTVGEALDALVNAVPPQGYLAVLAYLDRVGDAEAGALRRTLAERTGVQTTFGWGPRFLHSTGQYHKGGHPNGAFLEVTAEPVEDLEIPGQPFSFGTLITAQAAGDLTVLADKGYPTLRLHLRDRRAGLAAVLAAAEGAPEGAARPRTTSQLHG